MQSRALYTPVLQGIGNRCSAKALKKQKAAGNHTACFCFLTNLSKGIL